MHEERRAVCLRVSDDQSEVQYYWSCSFLPSARYCVSATSNNQIHHWTCQLCSGVWIFHDADVSNWTDRIEHLNYKHRYRACNQQLFTCAWEFLVHLTNEHSLSSPHEIFDLLRSYRRLKGSQQPGLNELHRELENKPDTQVVSTSNDATGCL